MRVRFSNVSLIAGGLEADAQSLDAPAAPIAGRVRLSNVVLIAGGLEADVEQLGAAPQPPASALPDGYGTNTRVANQMLVASMARHNLDAIAVQGHGQWIVDAVNADYPGLNAYVHPKSDAVMWPGFGDVDVTIDSGKGGFAFQPGYHTRYESDPEKR